MWLRKVENGSVPVADIATASGIASTATAVEVETTATERKTIGVEVVMVADITKMMVEVTVAKERVKPEKKGKTRSTRTPTEVEEVVATMDQVGTIPMAVRTVEAEEATITLRVEGRHG